jgi:hypothetical protein
MHMLLSGRLAKKAAIVEQMRLELRENGYGRYVITLELHNGWL